MMDQAHRLPSAPKTPWLESYDPDVPTHLHYGENTLFGALLATAGRYGDNVACDFMGFSMTYRTLLTRVRQCARGLVALGVRPGDRVTLCLPNCPQTVIAFYAVNLVGAVANLIHPLSAQAEITFYLQDSQSVAAITLTEFAPKFAAARKEIDLPTLIVTSPADELPSPVRLAYTLKTAGARADSEGCTHVLHWQDFFRLGRETALPNPRRQGKDPAVILYSGGTTGVTKGVLLSNRSFNALAAQILAANPMFAPGDKMLSVLPMFHGFGLGVSVHTMLWGGGRCVLSPRFTPTSYLALLKKHRPAFIAGVPSLYEALLRTEAPRGLKLDCLKGVFSGGDSLSPALKQRFDDFLAAHGATVGVREGYGATECVTASCLMPRHTVREGSIGLPLPDMLYKIVRPGTEIELPYGQEGEICLSGPTVMLGYVNQPQETAAALRVHGDGRTWVHTGDLGVMEADGFLYFRQRIKRMIVTNGYNIYPSRLEAVLDSHPDVQVSCVIGVPDAVRGQRLRAYVVPRSGCTASDELRQSLLMHCGRRVARYALPGDIEFRRDLPKTLVGKVAYRLLEAESGDEAAPAE